MRKVSRKILLSLLGILLLVSIVPNNIIHAAKVIVETKEQLQEAINNVGSGDTITLAADLEFESPISIDVGDSLTFVIDFDGHKITTKNDSAFNIVSGQITFTNGSIIANSSPLILDNPFAEEINGKLTLTNFNIESEGFGIWQVKMNLEISNTKIVTSSVPVFSFGGGETTFGENTEITGSEVVIVNNSTLNINDGTYNCGFKLIDDVALGIIKINGGAFKNDNGEVPEGVILPENKKLKKESDGYYRLFDADSLSLTIKANGHGEDLIINGIDKDNDLSVALLALNAWDEEREMIIDGYRFGVVGTKQSYANEDEYFADAEANIYVPMKQDTTVYVIWFEPIDKVEFDLERPIPDTETSTPIGDEGYDYDKQTNPPIFKSLTENVNDDIFKIWSIGSGDDLSLYQGPFEAGKTYNATAIVSPKFGYYFTDELQLLVNGEKIDEFDHAYDILFFVASVDCLNKYKLSFDLDGGSLDGKTGLVELEHIEGSIIKLPAPTKEGFEFDYWEGSKYYAGQDYTVTKDHTLKAIWKEKTTPSPSKQNKHTVPDTGAK